MFSPYKLTSIDSNFLEISSNLDLSNRLTEFFENYQSNYLWKCNTLRQTMAEELKNTCMIPLRHPVPLDPQLLKSTNQWNQVLNIEDTVILKQYKIFQELCQWTETSLSLTGAQHIELGRTFFSKHYKHSIIGLHTDQGSYFDYYDRFHFVINQSDGDNIFYIRDEPIALQTGKFYWVNNHVPHWLDNRSDMDRINLIFDARLT